MVASQLPICALERSHLDGGRAGDVPQVHLFEATVLRPSIPASLLALMTEQRLGRYVVQEVVGAGEWELFTGRETSICNATLP